MNQTRKARLRWTLFLLLTVAVGLTAILYALRDNINLFYTPSDVLVRHPAPTQTFRLGGMVVKGSVARNLETLDVQFAVTDYTHQVTIHYQGLLPDLFREGQGIVALGHLSKGGVFRATQVLAKHDENYQPPELRDLKKG